MYFKIALFLDTLRDSFFINQSDSSKKMAWSELNYCVLL